MENKLMQECAGINIDDIIKFQTRVMFGRHYKLIEDAKSEKDIIIACLRLACNDAFRHVTQNVAGTISDTKIKKILSGTVLTAFYNYAKKTTSKEKADFIINSINAEAKDDNIRTAFKEWKVIDKSISPDKFLCFGHFQKLFNMAMKYYLCLYMCKSALGIENKINKGRQITEDMLKNADCPIDSIILKNLGQFSAITWSQMNEPQPYIDTQEAINTHMKNKKRNGSTISSNLYYDFENWKEPPKDKSNKKD